MHREAGGQSRLSNSSVRGWSREWESDPRPADYESAALPLSYLGPLKIKDLFKTSTYLAAIFIKHSSFSSSLPKMLSDSAVKTVYLRNIRMAIQPLGFIVILSGTRPIRKLLTQDRLDREL